ncbi:MAG: hypothetical protein LBL75_01725 [Rickettsiales bacterium]|jgi:hypothetical protein|nr:hypothetical protein [Rickettsiales bacterium]
MAKTTKKESTPKTFISKWILNAPLKFAILTTIFLWGLPWLSDIIFGSFINISTLVAYIITLITTIFMLSRWTPNDALDNKSFIALNISQLLSIFITTMAMALLSFVIFPILGQNGYIIMVSVILITMMILFMFANLLLKIKTLFCRARNLGIEKWKLWLCIPFGIELLWFPGFLLNDSKKPVLTARAKWLGRLTEWVIKKPENTFMAAMTIIVLIGIFSLKSLLWSILFIVLAGLLSVMIIRSRGTKTNIGGIYTWGAMILNLLVIGLLVYGFYFVSQQKPVVIDEQIQITEIVPDATTEQPTQK